MRQAERAKINAKVQHRENMVAQGRHSAYIKALLGEQTPHNTLDSLQTHAGTITNPKDIHTTLTEHFSNHYSTPPLHQHGIHTPGWNWQTGGNKDQFLSLIKHHKIPAHLQEIIWSAMQTPPESTAVHTELSDIFTSPPSFDDFCTSIQRKPNKKAGGLTKTTYSMLKGWSLEYKQLVYDNIIPYWTTKQIPEWWTWTKLRLKPKDPDNITPDTLRPLVLVEVLRKVWIGLIIHQINSSWEKHNILNKSQHGFRPKRGTDTALLQLQTIFEQSTLSQAPIYLSSWDVKKAFDSLSKNTLRFSWTRLGVPDDIANLLVSLDEHGHTIISTPYSERRWKKKKYKGFATPQEYFTGERGAGQGDVGSPLNWVAAYDILLTALSTVTEGAFYIRRPNHTCTQADDIAYADDLISSMSTITGLQLKADIVSSFSIIFGLDIATAKLRTFLHSPSNLSTNQPS
jgi:hypothetical protein